MSSQSQIQDNLKIQAQIKHGLTPMSKRSPNNYKSSSSKISTTHIKCHTNIQIKSSNGYSPKTNIKSKQPIYIVIHNYSKTNRKSNCISTIGSSSNRINTNPHIKSHLSQIVTNSNSRDTKSPIHNNSQREREKGLKTQTPRPACCWPATEGDTVRAGFAAAVLGYGRLRWRCGGAGRGIRAAAVLLGRWRREEEQQQQEDA